MVGNTLAAGIKVTNLGSRETFQGSKEQMKLIRESNPKKVEGAEDCKNKLNMCFLLKHKIGQCMMRIEKETEQAVF